MGMVVGPIKNAADQIRSAARLGIIADILQLPLLRAICLSAWASRSAAFCGLPSHRHISSRRAAEISADSPSSTRSCAITSSILLVNLTSGLLGVGLGSNCGL